MVAHSFFGGLSCVEFDDTPLIGVRCRTNLFVQYFFTIIDKRIINSLDENCFAARMFSFVTTFMNRSPKIDKSEIDIFTSSIEK